MYLDYCILYFYAVLFLNCLCGCPILSVCMTIYSVPKQMSHVTKFNNGSFIRSIVRRIHSLSDAEQKKNKKKKQTGKRVLGNRRGRKTMRKVNKFFFLPIWTVFFFDYSKNNG